MLPQWKIFLYKLVLPLGMPASQAQADYTTLLHVRGSKGIECLGGSFTSLGGQYHFDQNFNLTLSAGIDSLKNPGIFYGKMKGLYALYPYKQRLFNYGLFGILGKINLNKQSLRPRLYALFGMQVEFIYSAYLSLCFESFILLAVGPELFNMPTRLWHGGIKINF